MHALTNFRHPNRRSSFLPILPGGRGLEFFTTYPSVCRSSRHPRIAVALVFCTSAPLSIW